VCDLETSKTRRLKPATGLWKIQPQWVVTPGKQTNKQQYKRMPIPVTVRSKAPVCSRTLAAIMGYNPGGGMDVCLFFLLLNAVEQQVIRCLVALTADARRVVT
jgi:hypothetical protein